MSNHTQKRRFFTGAGILLLVLLLGYLGINPWLLRWGATEEEVKQAMPGDLAHIGWTRGITIDGDVRMGATPTTSISLFFAATMPATCVP